MQSEQPTGLMWQLRSHPLVWATVIPIVSLFITALVAAYVLLPILPKDLRHVFSHVHMQVRSNAFFKAQQVELEDEVRRLAVAVKRDELTTDRCKASLQAIDSVLIGHKMATGIIHRYLRPADLSKAELAAAANTVRRYTAAFVAGNIDEATAMAIESHARETDESGATELRATLTADELRALLAEMAAAADSAGIGPTVEPVDTTQTVREIVDRTLAGERP